jgi:methionyl-tRNA formyltransferase
MLKKIVFMGTPIFAVPILKSLYQNGYSVSVAYTQPPQKSQRGQKINKSPIQGISETLKIECRTPGSLKGNKEEYNYLKELNADIGIVVAYGKIIPKEYLSLVKKGFINIHASLLPKWRGAAPIQRSIMNLEKVTGISIMRIGEKLDTGPVCNSYKIEITADDNSETISEKLSALAAEKILDNIDEILEDRMEFREQNHNLASYAVKIEKTEGQIEWGENAENIIGKINGLYLSPGAFFSYNGERYKILKASLAFGVGKIGEVLDNYLEVSCGNKKSIKVLEIQRQGKRPQSISEFMFGSKIKKGSNLNNA